MEKSKGNWQLLLVSNEKNAIYINESGFYQLVMRSKMKAAEQFQDYVYEVVLPSIRRMGQEKFMQQLAERDSLLEQKNNLLQESKEQIEKLERKQLQLSSYVENIQLLEKEQVFYIATTTAYAMQHRFKYGITI
jgi:prophage antirepressor-like protein